MASPSPAEGGAAASNAAGPSPLTVGKHFVKQYYQSLQNNPEFIVKFYQPSSLLSHAEGSNATDPSSLESYTEIILERWGIDGTKKGFAMEIGAIDAQTSINGSILLVVTGAVSSGKDPRKTFVHTFFLSLIPNTKRFYVANDVLRFLAQNTAGVEDESPEEVVESISDSETKEEEAVVEEAPVSDPVEEPALEKEEAPGGGVEESKEAAPEEEEEEDPAVDEAAETEVSPGDAAVSVEKVEQAKETDNTKESGRGKRGKGGKASQQPKQQPASKPPPGSWASLVASSPAVASPPVAPSPAKPTPAKAPAPEKVEPAEVKPSTPPNSAPPQEKETKEGGGKARGDRHKRDPDCTLVIKNLPDNTKDADLVALFEQFATSTNGKIMGTTVSAHRGLGFVDFDSVPPVMAAVAKHAEQPIELNGRVLEVDQKTAEQRARRNMRGGYRSGSPGNGGSYRGGGGSGGGRHNQYRRGGGGRGDRGGRGGRGGR